MPTANKSQIQQYIEKKEMKQKCCNTTLETRVKRAKQNHQAWLLLLTSIMLSIYICVYWYGFVHNLIHIQFISFFFFVIHSLLICIELCAIYVRAKNRRTHSLHYLWLHINIMIITLVCCCSFKLYESHNTDNYILCCVRVVNICICILKAEWKRVNLSRSMGLWRQIKRLITHVSFFFCFLFSLSLPQSRLRICYNINT